MEENSLKLKNKNVFARLLKYAASVKGAFILAVILMFISVGIDTVMPKVNAGLLELLGADIVDIKKLIMFFVAYVVLIITLVVISFYQHVTLQKAGQRIIYNIREEVFFKIENYSVDQINEIPIGKFVSRVTNDTQTLNEMYTNVLVGFIKNILQIVFVLVFMFLTSVKLTLITLCVAPFVLGASYIFRKL